MQKSIFGFHSVKILHRAEVAGEKNQQRFGRLWNWVNTGRVKKNQQRFGGIWNTGKGEIEKADNKSLSELIGALLYFQNSRALKWIEIIKDRIENVTTNWGVLAAASNFDWQTAKQWIESGRPLSLIALDALVYCTTTGSRANQSLWLQQHPPKLLNVERPEIIARTVNEYLKKNNVPRTKSAVTKIIDNIFVTNV